MFIKKRVMKKILLLFISLIFTQCSILDDSRGLDFDQNAFDQNRELWQENKISNYTFSQEYFSTSVGPQPKLTSIVINSELDTIFVQSKNATDISIDHLRYYATVADVYDFIEYIKNSCEEEINSDQSNMKGAEIIVSYDDTYHYPTEVNCSGYYPDGIVGGLSIQIIFSDFKLNP